ncbi:MAG: DUF1566 domain-containing protein [Alphaproteobacteria bacterium]|nr:DUF1566 domain-containing protein [Alphaproteobacteria bacterium]
MQWTSTAATPNNTLQYCNGSSWTSVGTTNTPDAFNFTDQSDVWTNTTISSNEVSLNGFTGALAAACTGCTAIARNGTWGGTSAAFLSGDTIAIRLASASTISTATTATVTVGGTTSSTWTVTTTANACAVSSPTPGTVCTDGSIYAGLSPDGSAKMYTTRCDQGMTWSGSACTGTSSTMPFSTAATCSTGYTSTTTGRTNSAGLASLSDACIPYNAATSCEDLDYLGHTDWYLPATGEISILYTNRTAIGNFTSTYYYLSSTEYSTSQSSLVYFNSGVIQNISKTNNNHVRCVRR